MLDTELTDFPPVVPVRKVSRQSQYLKCITMVAHFVVVLFTSFVVYTAWPGSSLFSWHPTLMTIAFTLLMLEAILMFSPESSLLQSSKRSLKVCFHWILQVLALLCAIGGAAVIIYNKEIHGKPHFKTWHGLLGLITVIYTLVQSVAGICLLYPSLVQWIKLAQLKIYHATSGLVLYTLVFFTLWLAMFSNWFVTNVTGTAWYACFSCPPILVLVVMQQVTSAYAPKRR